MSDANGNGHSRLIWWVIGGMGSIIGVLAVLLFNAYEQRYLKMSEVDARQDAQIQSLFTALESVKEFRAQTLGERTLILQGVNEQFNDVRRRLDRVEGRR